ncbi:hypothetical protein DMB92_00755 [Campylobacter sp. MIT 99-7217]|uniref:LptF/LptG family permease n=1 Tax=Campylobacter sp. MIT 99-7217 TaxID=535091 RepID=UPI00115843B9|nr:LptF/LptG family permease [Campylobacter sp. MIT 99-7217]TQR34526.1 hypothetical protein DMB92_00755 [Campylobacter sp. MIT 99-7217]
MRLIYKYFLNHFFSTNLSLFSVLFLIVSMVFFIQLARLTASIEIGFMDFLKLYSFMIPRILIFTLPVSFFISLALMLHKLSRENESIVCFALGFSPKYLGRFFLALAFVVSCFMLIVSLIFVPLASKLQKNFVEYKKTQVKLNLKTGEFGQNFLGWMIFIEENDGVKYKNIIMYNPQTKDKDKEQFIIAKEGLLQRDQNSLSFRLIDGNVYNFNESLSWHVGHFNDMTINSELSDLDPREENIYQYWKKMFSDDDRAKEFVIYTLIALFPMASALFALSFGLVTYRYDKGMVYFGIFIIIGLYFGIFSLFYKPPLLSVMLIFASFFIASVIYFKKKILSKY